MRVTIRSRSARGWLQACGWAAALASACVLAPAAASTLYQCSGRDGVTAFVSNPHGYSRCKQVGAWKTAVEARSRAASRRNQPSGTVLPGTPPRPVTANPRVLTVIPLGEDAPAPVPAAAPPVAADAWEPLPVALLQTLARSVLPRLLGVAAPPTPAAPPPAPAAMPAPPATAAIPLHVDTTAPKPPRRGAVYRVVGKNGTVMYTNIAALATGSNATRLFTYIIECYACDVHSKIDWQTVPLHLAEYHGDIQAAARLTGVDTALLRAVIHAESGFNPRALSYKGAQGLMQLMPGTAFELGVGDAFDPGENISGGARYLAMLLRDFHGDVKLAAAAYNAGAGAVTKYAGVPPYAETQVYVKRVALLYQRYRKALAEAVPATVAAAHR